MAEEAVASLKEEFESLRTDIRAFMVAQVATKEGGVSNAERPPEGDIPPTPQPDHEAAGGAPGPAADSLLEASATEVTEEFITLKDSLKSYRLPKELKTLLKKDSIKKEHQVSYGLISKCFEFTETAFRLLMRLQPGQQMTAENIRDLWVVQLTEMRYLQEEFANLQVQGRFDKLDPNISGIFRSLQKNTSGLNDDNLDLLHKAIDIAGAASRHPRASAQNTQRGRGFTRGQGQGRRGADVYSQFASKQFPRGGRGQSPSTSRDVTDL